MVLIFRLCDRCPPIIRDVLLERGWEESPEPDASSSSSSKDDELNRWNLLWKNSRFTASQMAIGCASRRLNHFPKSWEITRKDSMFRNLRKMKMIHGSIYHFFPETYVVPSDYVKFTQVFAEDEGNKSVWICKPSDLSRGRKIFLFRDISELVYDTQCVIQRYIDRPLLISGYKFDLRIYVLVTSFHPLTIFLYREGLTRFSTEKYDLSNLDSKYSHLTNASINKFNPALEAEKDTIGPGCKWSFQSLHEYFDRVGIDTNTLWRRIESVLMLALVSIGTTVPDSPGCFELFGFDIIIDEALKPWLLEINFSPALGIDNNLDIEVKRPLLHDIMDILNIPDVQTGKSDGYAGGGDQNRIRPRPYDIHNRKATRRMSSAASASFKSSSFSSAEDLASAYEKETAPMNEGGAHDPTRYGDFDMIFPFNSVTQDAAKKLGSKEKGGGETALRLIVSEIKAREVKYSVKSASAAAVASVAPISSSSGSSGHARRSSASASFAASYKPPSSASSGVRRYYEETDSEEEEKDVRGGDDDLEDEAEEAEAERVEKERQHRGKESMAAAAARSSSSSSSFSSIPLRRENTSSSSRKPPFPSSARSTSVPAIARISSAASSSSSSSSSSLSSGISAAAASAPSLPSSRKFRTKSPSSTSASLRRSMDSSSLSSSAAAAAALDSASFDIAHSLLSTYGSARPDKISFSEWMESKGNSSSLASAIASSRRPSARRVPSLSSSFR